MTKFVCDDCGAINEDPKHEFTQYEEDPEIDRNEYLWSWVCKLCKTYSKGSLVSEKMKEGIKNED